MMNFFTCDKNIKKTFENKTLLTLLFQVQHMISAAPKGLIY